MKLKYNNPIIPGFHPDPSICRVEDDFYLVTSSFEYFPGVPVFHSKDLLNWEQIGYCLTREEQLALHKVRSSGGIYAPTIRYHEGTFYMVTTNTSSGGNFYVFTDNPYGEWSDPIWVEQGGIDPSLMFDDDGKVYFTSNGPNGTYQCEIDIKTGKKLTDTRHIWAGTGGRYAEAPHLYKIKGMYYLMMAEGGTEYGHMETIARSSSPWGPFEGCHRNPILTHRDRGGHPIQGTGHADLVEDKDGNWWMVFLAFRPAFHMYHHIGRETFLAPITWDKEGWPVVNGNGTVELEMDSDKLSVEQKEIQYKRCEFDSEKPELYWNFLRNPHREDWSLYERKGFLTLHGSAVTLDDVDSPAFIGRRQQHHEFSTSTLLEFNPEAEGEEAGITVFMNENLHYEIYVTLRNGGRKLCLRRRIGSLWAVEAEKSIEKGPIVLEVSSDGHVYDFKYASGSSSLECVGSGEAMYLSSEVSGGFTGVYIGLYATGNGKKSSTSAYFDWFDYRAL